MTARFVATALFATVFLELFFAAKLPAGYGKTFPKICAGLYDLFMDYGANLLEINPLVLTKDGSVIAADAKVDLDDNALWKHPDVQAWNKAAPSVVRLSPA